MKTLLYSLFVCILFIQMNSSAQTTAKELIFSIQVTTTSYIPSITLKWNKQTGISSYNLLKKNRNEKSFTLLASNLVENDTIYTDYNVSIGSGYEYCVQGALNVNVSGYVYAGILLPEVHQAGEILLLIDSTYKEAAQFEIEDYKLDLIKEGWKVNTEFVGRTQSVNSVKQIIINYYNQNPLNLKGVILLGHVPVPYSGKVAPDAHADHIGAWPCDMYYANINTTESTSIWTDISLTTVTATQTRNHNIIGDGKFDASNKPTISAVKLFVGRIDVYNMPAINTNDVVLFKQYLAKNHVYRSGQKKFRQNAIVDDNFGYFAGEAFAQNGWRNFSTLLGSDKTESGDYINGTKQNSYIWSYGCGSGSYTSCQGIGNTGDFASNQMQSVFTMLYGSYYGDWDNQNNFLRAPIASPSSTLVSIWGGRPNWFLHTMAMGEPIGYSYINSVDNANTYFPKGYYSNKIHQALQGDPTLKMYMFDAPTRVITSSYDNDTKVKIEWTASSDPNVLGYYIYRANSLQEDFILLNATYETTTTFIDETQGIDVAGIYMVKAVKLEQTNSGTFYNLSPGVMSLENPIAAALPVTITNFTGVANNNQTNTLYWNVQNELNLSGYAVERSANGQAFETIGFINATAGNASEYQYSFTDLKPSTISNYRLKNLDIDGKFSYTHIVSLTNLKSDLLVSVYPSPFTSQLNISYSSEVNTMINILIQDMTGKVIVSQQSAIVAGQNNIRLSDLEKLRNQLYIVRIEDAENTRKDIIRIMKQ